MATNSKPKHKSFWRMANPHAADRRKKRTKSPRLKTIPGTTKPFLNISHLTQNQKKDYYSALSHIFRQPLVGASGYVDYLFKGYSGPLSGEQQLQLGHARGSILRLEKSLDIFLDMVAFDLQLITLKSESIEVNHFFSHQSETWREWIESEERQFTLHLLPRPITHKLDTKWIQLLVRELLSNALRVSPIQGQITLGFQKNKEGLLMTVSDEGPGVPDNCLEWIFNPFTQLRRENDPPKGERGGLGLTLAKQITQLHRGKIWATRRKPAGLTVSVQLP